MTDEKLAVLDHVPYIDKYVYKRKEKDISTEIYQPAAFLVEMGIVHLLNKKGIIAENFAGSSLGEYSALASANYLKIEDGKTLLFDFVNAVGIEEEIDQGSSTYKIYYKEDPGAQWYDINAVYVCEDTDTLVILMETVKSLGKPQYILDDNNLS